MKTKTKRTNKSMEMVKQLITVRRQFNTYPKVYKKRSQKSLTVPDQNMSIRTLLDRHSRGIPLGASEKKGEYFDTEIPRFDDLTDVVAYKKMLAQKHKELDLQVNSEIKAKKQKEEALRQELAPSEVAPPKSEE
tara:strand:- start:87 stop:488 length:402 start_codon:yes stop_codon:yes gene_type:complete